MRHIAALTAIVAIAWIRFRYCAELPINTGDISRHLITALAVLKHGLHVAGLPLRDLVAQQFLLNNLPYPYPIVTLGFWVWIAKIYPSIFAGKFALTVIEAVNAWQVGRLTRSKWAGVLYWAMPCSIWWVSHEGQFEPLQNFFSLAALGFLPSFPAIAGSLLALGVQTKLTAVLLLPLLLWKSRGHGYLVRFSVGFILGFIPTLIAQTQYDCIRISMGYGVLMMTGHVPQLYNPYYWNPFDQTYWSWMSAGLRASIQFTTYALLAGFVWWAIKSRRYLESIAPIGFLVACKLSTQAQWWYLILLPSFALPAVMPGFWVSQLVMDPLSIGQMIYGPFGYTVPGYYGTVQPFSWMNLNDGLIHMRAFRAIPQAMGIVYATIVGIGLLGGVVAFLIEAEKYVRARYTKS